MFSSSLKFEKYSQVNGYNGPENICRAACIVKNSIPNCDLLNPLPDDKILDRSKLKQSADDNSRFDENSRKFSKWVENTVGKGEIARYQQFLLFPQCFQKACFLEASKSVIVWEWVKSVNLYHAILT